MQLFGQCCSSCKFCKVRMKPCGAGSKSVAWCLKHRDIFDLHSLCESYECKENEVTNDNSSNNG